MLMRKARAIGEVVAMSPPLEELQHAEISQSFAFRLVTPLSAADVEAALRSVGDVEQVQVLTGRGRQRTSSAVTAPDEQELAPPTEATVRIEVSRLDRLANLIGELAHARDQLSALVTARGESSLAPAMTRVSLLIEDLEAEARASRLVPAWHLFDRYPRLVRDAAREMGKEIDFIVEGREQPVDRFLLDEIGEPVVHLVRNAVAHGIETPAVREAAGKPRVGRIVLSLSREGTTTLVRVSDDGRGIDRRRVLDRARELGLVEPEAAALDDEALLRILAVPGFSLAGAVSRLSGRGVGVDAVQSRMRQLGGVVALESAVGVGTTVTLRI